MRDPRKSLLKTFKDARNLKVKRKMRVTDLTVVKWDLSKNTRN